MTASSDVGERGYRSIGEVLAEVQDEFPEITISKIRFLESQGLIDPERTASGYRKFYARDVDRLRYILRSQKDAYLPLKVIKDRLDQGDDLVAVPLAVTGKVDITQPVPIIVPGMEPPVDVVAAADPDVPARLPVWMQPKPAPTTPAAPSLLTSVDGGVSLSFDELVKASGLTHAQVREIESFGLISSTAIGRDRMYDEDALVVTRIVAEFAAQGLETRHLRMYQTTADREAGLFEQVAAPLIRQRNPQARLDAMRRLDAMVSLGDQLRSALLRKALRPYANPPGTVS